MGKHTDNFDQSQVQAILDKNEAYDILLFVQIPAEYLLPDVKAYMETHATFTGRGKDPEFFYRVSKLEDEAIPHFARWKDKAMLQQVQKLAADLPACQYIHVIY